MRRSTKRKLCTALTVLCLLSALGFACSLYQTLKAYQQGDRDIELMREARGDAPILTPRAELENMDEPVRRAVEYQEEQARLESYARLKEANSDAIGWIRIEGTEVDYPVMHTPEEPDYYLRRGFDKKYSVYGMIYMDGNCTLDEDSPNYLLYGHHMKNGSMFASIERYSSEDYYKQHPFIEFDTLEETGTYEVVAAFKLAAIRMDEEFAYKLAARTEKDYEALIDYIKSTGFYDTGITAQWPEQLITLTTCEYSQKDGRFFVVAKKVND